MYDTMLPHQNVLHHSGQVSVSRSDLKEALGSRQLGRKATDTLFNTDGDTAEHGQ